MLKKYWRKRKILCLDKKLFEIVCHHFDAVVSDKFTPWSNVERNRKAYFKIKINLWPLINQCFFLKCTKKTLGRIQLNRKRNFYNYKINYKKYASKNVFGRQHDCFYENSRVSKTSDFRFLRLNFRAIFCRHFILLFLRKRMEHFKNKY